MNIDLSVEDWVMIHDCVAERLRIILELQKKLLNALKETKQKEEQVEPPPVVERSVILKAEPDKTHKKGARVGRRPNWMIAEGLNWDDVERTPDGRIQKKNHQPTQTETKPTPLSAAVTENMCVRALALRGDKPTHIGDLCTAIAAANPGTKVQIASVEELMRSNKNRFVVTHDHYWALIA